MDTLEGARKRLDQVLIEKVSNGFIVREDHGINPRAIPERSHEIKVFQTKTSLSNFLGKNL